MIICLYTCMYMRMRSQICANVHAVASVVCVDSVLPWISTTHTAIDYLGHIYEEIMCRYVQMNIQSSSEWLLIIAECIH